MRSAKMWVVAAVMTGGTKRFMREGAVDRYLIERVKYTRVVPGRVYTVESRVVPQTTLLYISLFTRTY